MNLFLTTIGLSALAGASLYGQTAITGAVHDDLGAVPTGTVVQIHQVLPPSGKSASGGTVVTAGYSASVNLSADGSFIFSGAPIGNYYICAYTTSQNLISNCDWTPRANFITTGPGGTPEPLALIVTHGTIITIDLGDNAGLLQQASHHFYVGVMTASGYYPRAKLTSASVNARSYVTTIPQNVSANVFIDSDLTIKDSAGNILALRKPSDLALQGGSDTVVQLFVN